MKKLKEISKVFNEKEPVRMCRTMNDIMYQGQLTYTHRCHNKLNDRTDFFFSTYIHYMI